MRSEFGVIEVCVNDTVLYLNSIVPIRPLVEEVVDEDEEDDDDEPENGKKSKPDKECNASLAPVDVETSDDRNDQLTVPATG